MSLCYGGFGLAAGSRRHELERNLQAGLGDDDFGVGELFFEAGCEPGSGGWVAVDEEDFLGSGFDCEVEEFFAAGVAGKVEFMDFAVERNFVGSVETDEVAGVGSTNDAAGGIGCRVADEEEGVFFVGEKAAGEDIGDGLLAHHTAREAEDGTGFVFDGSALAAALSGDDVHVAEDFKSGARTAGGAGEFIVSHRHLGAQAADVDRGMFGDATFVLEVVEHGEDLLGFADGEDGNERGASGVEGIVDALREAFFLIGPGVVGGAFVGTAGGFHDEEIGFVEIRKASAFDEGMVFEVNISGVEDRFVLFFDEDACGAHDVACVVEGDRSAIDVSFSEVEGAFVFAGHPAFLEVFDFAMMKERVFLDAQFGGLAGHDIDRIVEEILAESRGAGGEVDRSGRLVSLGDWESADVIEVGVRDDDAIDAIEGDLLVAGQGIGSFFLGMHSGIE